MSTDRGMDKEDVVHIYNEILLSHKKEWNNTICSNMDGPRNYHSKWSQRQMSYGNTYIYNLKKKKAYKRTYLQNRNRLTDFEN